MRVPEFIVRPLRNWLWRNVSSVRAYDFRVGTAEDPYLLRWWVIPRNRWCNVYLHLFLRSDDPRALHDHMYLNGSLLLSGSYTEHTIAAGGTARRTRRNVGALKIRTPWAAHRIELDDGLAASRLTGPLACWSLFVTGPRVRSWGFHCPNGWVDWRDFTDPDDAGAIGPGCGAAE